MITQNKVEFFAPGEPITSDHIRAIAKRKMRREKRLSGSISIQMEILVKRPPDHDIKIIQSIVVGAMCGIVFPDTARLRVIDAAIKQSEETGVIVVVKEGV